MVWHIIRTKILLIINIILTDGIRMFLNTLTKKIEANCKITIFCSGIINLLFDGLAYNTSGHFAPAGLGKIPRNSQNIRTYYMLNHRIRCIYHSFKIFLHFWLAKIPCMIHHNQLLSTKFGRILQYWIWLLYNLKNYDDLGGCYPPRPIYLPRSP